MPEQEWPFDQPRNAATITLRSIVFGGAPILHVTHDEDDHGWQFLGMEDARESDACVVGLQTIVAKDPSVLEIADLPPGWHAWRSSTGSPWQRAPNTHEDSADDCHAEDYPLPVVSTPRSSIGSGKTMVEFCSAAISFSVCK